MGRPSLRHPLRSRPARRRLVRASALFAAIGLALVVPATVLAHPLGNFTINHYAGLMVGRDGVDVDVVIDMAEIPTFQERQDMDTDGDGSVADDEADAWGVTACTTLGTSLQLVAAGTPLTPTPTSHAVSFRPGAGGLSTLRLECGYHAAYPSALVQPTTLTFSDGSYAERIGWREILAAGDGTTLDTHGLPATSPSAKLTAYPASMIAQPLDIRSATIDVRPLPGAAASAEAGTPPPAANPAPIGGADGAPVTAAGPVADSPAGAVPGGVAGELPDIFSTSSLTPLVVLVALATAVGIGALHALTPGHGKTLMAAYLVGSRGTSVHAIGLGLSVAVSHTIGILVLALIVVGAEGILAPDVVVRTTPVIAAFSIVGVGAWMLIGETRRRRVAADPHRQADDGHHDQDAARDHGHAHPHDHTHHDHAHPMAAPAAKATHDHAALDAGEHSHGGVRHTHLPPAGSTLSWRGLFVLGLAGGLIPSTSALVILLSSIYAGRPAFGLVLVVAFGLGMAAVMTGVGLAMVFARTRLDRMPSRSSLGRLAAAAPLLASVAVLALGVYLTWSAVASQPVL